MDGGIRSRLLAAAVLLAAAALFAVRLGDRAVVSEEVRWAEIAREMRATGDYLRPTFNGHTYFDKPVASYWLIVAASWLTGEVDETAARLPAAVAGVVGVGVVMALGRRLYDARAGVAAGAVLATSYGYAFYARRATADLETVTGVLVAVWWYARHAGRPGGPWVVGLWLWMAAVSLTKGLLGVALPLAVFAADGGWAAWRGRSLAPARWLLTPWTLAAVPLAGLAYLLPFAMADGGLDGGLALVWRENVRRFYAPHNHAGPVWLYAGVAFVLAAPWSAFLPAALLPAAGRSPGDRLARAYFWAVFAFFTASASRRSYYLLPVLPAAALLIGHVLTAPALDRWPRRLRAGGWVLLGVGVAAAGAAMIPPAWVLSPPYDALPPLPARGWYAAGWLLALVAAVAAARRPGWRIGVAAGGAFAALGYVFGVAAPAVDDLRTRRDFVAVVRTRTAAAPDRLALYHAGEIVFDLRRTAPDYLTPAELAAAARFRWLVVPRKKLAEVGEAGVVAEEAAHPWESAERLGNKLVLIDRGP